MRSFSFFFVFFFSLSLSKEYVEIEDCVSGLSSSVFSKITILFMQRPLKSLDFNLKRLKLSGSLQTSHISRVFDDQRWFNALIGSLISVAVTCYIIQTNHPFVLSRLLAAGLYAQLRTLMLC